LLLSSHKGTSCPPLGHVTAAEQMLGQSGEAVGSQHHSQRTMGKSKAGITTKAEEKYKKKKMHRNTRAEAKAAQSIWEPSHPAAEYKNRNCPKK